MGTFKMRLLLIATSLALATAAPHSEDRQKWRPAQGRDLSKFKPKLPEVAFGTHQRPGQHQNHLSSRRETRALQRSAVLKIQMELKTGLLVVMKPLTTNGPGRSPSSSTM